MSGTPSYLLGDSANEVDRLRLQATMWEPAANAMLDAIGVTAGWSCIDLACGASGVLAPLSRRAGRRGRVVGVDVDAVQLEAARAGARQQGLFNVEIVECDAFRTGLPARSFDLVHARFLAAPTGRAGDLLEEARRLARPGGVIAIEEPDTASWRQTPACPAWDRLKSIIEKSFTVGGGDFDVGRQIFAIMRQAGLAGVEVRGAVLALPGGHPYARCPLQIVHSLRPHIIRHRLASENELDTLVSEFGRSAENADVLTTTFILIQVWGRIPSGP